MSISQQQKDVERLQQEIDRYRTAAEMGLEQIETCADLLAANGQKGIARALRANRSAIRRGMEPR
jgi:hypothetical protein